MNKRILNEILAGIMTLSIIVSIVPSQTINATSNDALATENENEETIEYERIEIKSAQDLMNFAKNCYIDSWSKDKYVILENDISLTDTEITPIAVFDGIFDGNNHTISNFDYVGDGYVTGLFRYIESDGVVKNLTLKGNVESENEEECIGSICGINYGTITNCTFQGTVSGRDTVGGIVGINEESGMVSKCSSKGRVTAYYSTGGIVGINHGDINNCTNRAGINDDTAWVEEDDEMGGVELVKSLVSNDDSEVYSGVDTGGIAGYSDGLISRCTNYGIVGYEHTGYNIGGIAGRQSGVISLCTNSGTVYGRKDVGGIAGQMEPYIEIDEAESLRNAIDKLHDLIEQTLDDMDASSEVLNNDVDSMMSYADTAIDTGDELIDELESFVNDNLDEVNSASDRLDHIMDMIPDVLDNIDLAGDAMDRFNDIVVELMDDLDIMDKLEDTPYNETDYNRLSLLSTVGGTLSTNKTSPQEGDEVVITATPDDGYKLSKIVVTDAKGNTYTTTQDGDKYTFTMPSENVKVEAYYEYVGTFLLKSTPGGTIKEDSVNGDKYTFKAESSSNAYDFKGFQVNGEDREEYPQGSKTITLDKSDEIEKNGNKSVTVSAIFERNEKETYSVTVLSGTGGTATVDKRVAAEGDEVTITITEDKENGYTLDKVTVTDKDSTRVQVNNGKQASQRTFKMPASDVKVEVTFKDDSDTKVHVQSGVGGRILRSSPTGNQYTIRIKPDDGYKINKITITTSGIATTSNYSVNEDEGTSDTVETVQYSHDEIYEDENKDTGEKEDTDENKDTGEKEDTDDEEDNNNPVDTKTIEDSIAPLAAIAGSNDLDLDTLDGPDDEGWYSFVYELNSDEAVIDAYFEEDNSPNTDTSAQYSVSAVASTGGTVTTSMTTASEGDTVTVTVKPLGGYILEKLYSDGSNVEFNATSNGNYSFKMPASNVTVNAQFTPIDIILTSNLSGNATYTGNSDGTVTIRISPDSAYTPASAPTVKDADGKSIGVRKKQNGSYVYEFNVSDIGKSPCTVTINFKKENQSQAVETSTEEISDSVGELSDSAAQVQDSVNVIRDIVMDGDTAREWNDLSSDEKSQVIEEITNLLDYLGDMSSSAASILRNLTTIYNILEPYVTEAAKAAKDDIDRATDVVDEMLDYLKEANNNVKAIVNYINGQASLKFTQLGSDFDETKENFHDQLRDLSDSVKTLSDNSKDCSEKVNDDLRAVNDQLNVVLNLLADRLVDMEDLSIEELYEEVDEDDIDSITTGRVDICTNKGTIEGDINVGGIAGSMAIDDEDPEDSAAGEIEYEIGRRFITKCLVTESVNDGFVTAKKDGAGGICGYMNHGIILDSEGYGSVESTEGDYVGGICGESLTIIRRCYSIASVSGGQNVGGIAGYGQTITDCYSMSNVSAENGRVGAIAGEVASYEETPNNENLIEEKSSTTPEVYGNYYVDDELYGIDNISYVGVAEPLTYNELLEVENLPTNFWHPQVIYKIEDTYLGSQEVGYGKKLDNLTYPTIPEKEGYYGVWPDVTDEKMKGVVVVEAEYVDNVTVVQSSGVEEGKPLAFIEDRFTKDTVLIAKMSIFAPPTEVRDKQNVVYELSLVDDMVSDDDTFQVRLLNPYGDDVAVYGYIDGAWTELESKVRGQYIQVEMKGTSEYFCIVNNKSGNIIKIIVAALAAVIVIIVIVLIKKGILRRKNKKLGA